ncbi:uncharacterized protein AMSG_09608 [Thecamonas trahens ATCC 50062]|uniref:Cyclic nucleotide-binding domain-containing protein n=1 Tax=Thecamonas trahens ATCC 50062 TaxID=461836 RepID=A0A0L0DNR7_THETB|nr:hypothetical protein AMSG_09608 [Thecamonas trahens ATCC 50062]KNC53962.1 hypothetical protein AMSG_09608 [Thecamonas trahens ATCC 50062]|eukprot:XP_013754164.1 hypothetical protein AMSG_09608 [Thecamonas trahens ATCC 50062]
MTGEGKGSSSTPALVARAEAAAASQRQSPHRGRRQPRPVRKRLTAPAAAYETNLTFEPELTRLARRTPQRYSTEAFDSAGAGHASHDDPAGGQQQPLLYDDHGGWSLGSESDGTVVSAKLHGPHANCGESHPFHPELNRKSRRLVAAKAKAFPQGVHYEVMFRSASERSEHLAAHRSAALDAEMEQCTFHPTVLPGPAHTRRSPSHRSDSASPARVPVPERTRAWLSEAEAGKERARREAAERAALDEVAECSFRPVINEDRAFERTLEVSCVATVADEHKFVRRMRTGSASPGVHGQSGRRRESSRLRGDSSTRCHSAGKTPALAVQATLRLPVEPQYGYLASGKPALESGSKAEVVSESISNTSSTMADGTPAASPRKKVVVIKKRRKGPSAAEVAAAQAAAAEAGAQVVELEARLAEMATALATAQAAAAEASAAAAVKPDSVDVGVQTEEQAQIESCLSWVGSDDGGDEAELDAEAGAAEIESHRAEMAAASEDVRMCMAKIRAAHGDEFRMGAACALAKDVAMTIGRMLGGLLSVTAEHGDSSDVQHLVQLQNNMHSISHDLADLTMAIKANPADGSLAAQLEATLTRLEDLSQQSLSTGGAFAVKADLLEAMAKVPIFAGVHNAGFFNELVRKLEEETHDPDSLIFAKGDDGESMYFVTRGVVAVIAVVVGGKRTASVKAISYVYCYRLDKAVFYAALAAYPQYRSHFAAIAQERLHKDAKRRERAERGVKMQLSEVHRFRARVGLVFDSLALAVNTHDPHALGAQLAELDALLPELIEVLDEPEAKAALREVQSKRANVDTTPGAPELEAFVASARETVDHHMSISEMGDFLEVYDGFARTSDAFRAAVLASCKLVALDQGAEVIGAGSTARSLHFVVHGGLSVYLPGGELVGVLREGNFVGETAFWSGCAQPYRVEAVTLRADVVTLTWDDFAAVCASYPGEPVGHEP